jgi:hypothetical protein
LFTPAEPAIGNFASLVGDARSRCGREVGLPDSLLQQRDFLSWLARSAGYLHRGASGSNHKFGRLTEAQQSRLTPLQPSRPSRNLATERRPCTDPLRCRPGSRADRSRGASCRFRDGQRAHVLHCVRCSRPFPRAALRVLHLATVQRSAGAVKAESLV